MEIETITVDAPYCFGDVPLKLDHLAKVNFIFAPNGSGKTTISKALAEQPDDPTERAAWPVAPTDLPIRVFNESYRARVLTEYVGGIFTMGDESERVNKEIKALQDSKTARRNDREMWNAEIGAGGDPDKWSGLRGDIAREGKTAADVVFEAHKDAPRVAMEIVFKGFRKDKAKFLTEALRRFSPDHPAPKGVTWESLEARASTLTGDKQARSRLPPILTKSLISSQDIARVGIASTSTGRGEFAALIQHLGNEEWVSAGREYLPAAEGLCPFCQLRAPENLEASLAEYFAGGFDSALAQATAIDDQVKADGAKLEGELSLLESALLADPEIEVQAFDVAISGLRTAADLLRSQLDQKRQHPTRAVEVSDVSDQASELSRLIDATNATVDQHNAIVANVELEVKRLVEDGWALFLSERTAQVALKRYTGVSTHKTTQIAELEARISESNEADKDAELRIAQLRTSISNTAEVADRINGLLDAMGFHRFQLEVANDVTGGYRIVRDDGTVAIDTLSEGEKSFICFAYFWESLSGSAVAGGEPDEVVAVIDDPISSLDSDSLFIVAAYVRDAARSVMAGKGNVRQLIVLTHNTQFHHEAAYESRDSSRADRHYFRLQKRHNGPTVVHDDLNTCRIRGTYPMLWDAVVEAARGAEGSRLVQVGVVNIVRRVIEGYFRTIGNMRDHTRPAGVTPVEERVMFMFDIWANSGSHTIADDLDQTVEVGSTARFLQLFHEYFGFMGHAAHFEMMVRGSGGADLFDEGGLFGSVD